VHAPQPPWLRPREQRQRARPGQERRRTQGAYAIAAGVDECLHAIELEPAHVSKLNAEQRFDGSLLTHILEHRLQLQGVGFWTCDEQRISRWR
jgi:hypothetical protein